VSIVIGMLLSAGVAAADGRKSVPSLCATPGQETLFTCQAGSKTISVCYSPTKDSTEGELAYIYGVAGKPAEIALHGSPATVKFSQNTGASGRNFFLAFLNGTYSYVVYKNEDKYDMPMNASGVVVKNAGKQIAWLGCTTDNDTTETIWHLDSHPELVSADSTTTTNIKLPDEPLTPCGWLPKADFKKYCNY
jgi:hypothetical protein